MERVGFVIKTICALWGWLIIARHKYLFPAAGEDIKGGSQEVQLAKHRESNSGLVIFIPSRTTVPDGTAAEIKYEAPYVTFIVFRSSIFS